MFHIKINGEENENNALLKSNTNVELTIAQETHQDVKQIEQDVGLLPELMHSIRHLIWDQGLSLNVAEESIESSVEETLQAAESLEKAEQYVDNTHKIRDATIIATGTGIGSLAWLGGPWFGIPGTAAGLGVSSGIVFIMRKVGV